MSRHDLQPRPDRPQVIRATVGWDRPLRTFFAQVFFATINEPEEGEALVWFGTAPGELSTPEAALAIVEPHAILPADLAARLEAEMNDTVGIRDGVQQAAAKRWLFGTNQSANRPAT